MTLLGSRQELVRRKRTVDEMRSRYEHDQISLSPNKA